MRISVGSCARCTQSEQFGYRQKKSMDAMPCPLFSGQPGYQPALLTTSPARHSRLARNWRRSFTLSAATHTNPTVINTDRASLLPYFQNAHEVRARPSPVASNNSESFIRSSRRACGISGLICFGRKCPDCDGEAVTANPASNPDGLPGKAHRLTTCLRPACGLLLLPNCLLPPVCTMRLGLLPQWQGAPGSFLHRSFPERLL